VWGNPGNLPDVRRLITFRGVWLTLLAALVAATVVVVVRSRRRPARTGPVQPDAVIADAPRPPVAPWPPAPILGTPTAEDLRRYATGPTLVDHPAFVRFVEGSEPRQPLEEATRRYLARWAVIGLVLAALAAGTYVVESRVYSKHPVGAEEAVVSTPPTPDPAPTWSPDLDCRPPGAEPRRRALDPKVVRAVNRQWRRIEAWLRINAPRTYATLGKPGRAGTIAVAEAQMGLRFPDDLRASLLRHNGVVRSRDTAAFGFLGKPYLSVREIRDHWRLLCETDQEDQSDGGVADPRAQWWDGRMIPFAENGMGDHLVIDSVAGDVGSSEQEGTMSFRPGEVAIPSYYALLKATADAMENGGSIGHWRPERVAGELGWKAR